MNMRDIILKKRNCGTLSKEEIEYIVKRYTEGEIPDYQVSALLMTFYFNGLDHEEVFNLTSAMTRSGDTIDLSGISGIKVDKHSTGGVGDKTTFIVAPIVAACGVPVAKMSGRGLGFTGGTIDKMESIPGMKTSLTEDEFIDQVNRIGISIIGQTGEVAPADKKFYALRDVTATVDNPGLIASSIMSKKLASGADAIVLDVKCGSGAFMKDLNQAEELSEILVKIGKNAGKKTTAVISNMNQPLGKNVGNSLEVIEAIETLKGKGPEDITQLSIELASLMIISGGVSSNHEEAIKMVTETLQSGKALDKFCEFIEAQGGDTRIIDDYTLLGEAKYSEEVISDTAGFVNEIDASTVGFASQHSGAGRSKKEDPIDMNAGIILNKKIGDRVEEDQLLATVYSNTKENAIKGKDILKDAFLVKENKPDPSELIYKII